MKLISPTYGPVDIKQCVEIMQKFYNQHEGIFNIVIGTDSQNFSETKIVTVIAMQCEGNGGIYFYNIEYVEKIRDVRKKLNYETQKSLEYADALLEIIEKDAEELYLNCNFSIHVDAGNSEHGKTKELIPGIVGWIHSCGYECNVKPNSFAASSIANKISK